MRESILEPLDNSKQHITVFMIGWNVGNFMLMGLVNAYFIKVMKPLNISQTFLFLNNINSFCMKYVSQGFACIPVKHGFQNKMFVLNAR